MVKKRKQQSEKPIYKPKAIEITCRGFGIDKKECLKREGCLRYDAFLLDKQLDKKRVELVYCVFLTNTVECKFFVEELDR